MPSMIEQKPHKERGLWNFLTWSFFISQVLAAEQLIGAAAQAAPETPSPGSDAPIARTAEAAAGTFPAVGVRKVGSADDADQAGANSHHAALDDRAAGPAAADHQASRGADAHAGKHPSIDGLIASDGVAAATDDADASLGSAAAHTDPGLDLGAVLSPDLGLDLHLDLGLDLGGVLADIGGGLPNLVGDLAGDTLQSVVGVAGTVAHAVGDLAEHTLQPLLGSVGELADPLAQLVGHAASPIDSLVGGVIAAVGGDSAGGAATEAVVGTLGTVADAATDIVASSGELLFKGLGGSQGLAADELFVAGKYSDYNLALQSSAATGGALAQPLSIAAPVVSIVDGLLGAEENGAHEDAQHGQSLSSVIALPSVVEELGLRGLGDGIV
jgi:hypothetical protein